MALTQTKVDDEHDQHELLHHFLHEHPLSITEKEQYDEVFCRICGQSSSGMFYDCDNCHFYLHQSCAKLPETIQYPCHPCLLSLSFIGIGSFDEYNDTDYEEAWCKMCGNSLESGFYYRCEPCNFNLHIDCALLPYRMESQGKQLFQHFSHHHPLTLIEIKDDNDVYECFACSELSCSGQPHLICCLDRCSFSLHDSCFNLPQEIHRPFHQHPLTLDSRKYEWLKNCDASCLKDSCGFCFHCKQCIFVVDVKCAFLRSTIDEDRDEILHFSHIHPLRITEKKRDVDDDGGVYCRVCGEGNSGMLYGCDHCHFYLHQSCSELPQKLQHFYHPCLLILVYNNHDYSSCSVCENEVKGFNYNCEACHFRMEIDCALLPSKMECQGQQQFHHFSHGHPLTLVEREHADEIKCSACLKRCSGQTYLCCKENCKFSLHDSCFSLPQKIHHPFHPQHPLTLTPKPLNRYVPLTTCYVCYNYNHGFTYSCHEFGDDFNMDAECPVALSTINYQGHHHNLLFIENAGPGIDERFHKECAACGTCCRSSTSIFHCMECEIILHLECGPLPLTIQHESHIDPLTLTDSPAVIDREDTLDTDVFYCDTCEEERDPRLPVYYCSDGCAYLAEMKCVMSEVMHSLRGEYGEVELMSPIRHLAGRVISKGVVKGIDLKEAAGQDRETQLEKKTGKVKIKPSMTFEKICKFLTAEESEEWSSIWNAAYKDQDSNSSKSIEQTFLISGEAYNKFVKLLDSRKCESRDRWQYEEVVNVGDHFIPRSLAPILEKLCAKYRDISVESTVKSSKVKMCCIVKFCGTLNSMCSTRVLDISDDLLFIWWTNLKTLQFAGFQVHFAFDRLKRVIDAYYGLSLKQKVKQDLEKIDEGISEVSQYIEELKAKLAAETDKLEALKERRKSTTESIESMNSSEVSKCLKEASLLKWMIAGDGLL